jgi:hypothetical protein
MFHFKLLQLEGELLAKELIEQKLSLTPECQELLNFIEIEIGVRLGDAVPKGWRGWLCYRRHQNSLVVCRSRAFNEGSVIQKFRAGLDVSYGLDPITEYERGFDITPPTELDHLIVNFRLGENPHILLWYGENIAPYQLFYDQEASYSIEQELKDAIAEGCIWILTKPKNLTLAEFLKSSSKQI